LAGCSLSPFVEHNSIDYGTAIEQVSNTSLVTNVLRGRDSAPLYFPDLSQVRGSITASVATNTTIPWKGPSTGSTQAGPFSAQTNPTFDIAPTNTKQFYQGLLNPISESLFAYFVERVRGYGTFEWAFHLLVSGIEVLRPGEARAFYSWNDREFLALADLWLENLEYQPIVVRTKGSPKPYGPPLIPDPKAITQASSSGLEVRSVGNGTMMQFMKGASSGSVICFYDGTAYTPVSIVQNSVVKGPAGETNMPETKRVSACPGGRDGARYTLHVRSVEQIFYYLGALVAADASEEFVRQSGPHKGCPRIPFFLSPVPTGHVRFAVDYRGSTHFVSDTTNRVECGGRLIVDNTMPILAILNDLLNLNRDANETPTTKAVQAVGGG
jgi:hypothetical protein